MKFERNVQLTLFSQERCCSSLDESYHLRIGRIYSSKKMKKHSFNVHSSFLNHHHHPTTHGKHSNHHQFNKNDFYGNNRYHRDENNEQVENSTFPNKAQSSSSESSFNNKSVSWLGLTRVNKVDERFRTNQSRDLALQFLDDEEELKSNEPTITQENDETHEQDNNENRKKRKYSSEEDDEELDDTPRLFDDDVESEQEEDERELDISERTNDATTAAVINIWAKKQKINEHKDVRLGNVWVMSNARVPVDKASLSKNITDALQNRPNPIHELFAVQRAVVPVLIAMSKSGTPGDICIGSPTGSGKTLAYVLPIVEVLSSLKFTKLRAIVVTPTHQLVNQVASVFLSFESCTSLTVKALNPHNRFEIEQAELIDPNTGDAKVDIVVGQPYLIYEHIKKTKGFTLKNLRFIVYDEVDALLSDEHSSFVKGISDAYHNW